MNAQEYDREGCAQTHHNTREPAIHHRARVYRHADTIAMNESTAESSGAATTPPIDLSARFTAGFTALANERAAEVELSSSDGKSKRYKGKPLVDIWKWAVDTWNANGKFGYWDAGAMAFGRPVSDASGLPLATKLIGKVRAFLIWRAFKFALRSQAGGQITAEGAADGERSFGHESGLMLYKPGRTVKVKGAEPPWPDQIKQFVRYVLPMPDTPYQLDGQTIQVSKTKYPLGAADDQSIVFYQVFWGLIAGARDIPENVVRIDVSKPLPYAAGSQYQDLVVLVEKDMRAKAFLQDMRSRVRQNIADFADPVKFQRSPDFDKVAAAFKRDIIRKTAEIKAAKEQLRGLVSELAELINARDLRLHQLDPNAPIKPTDVNAVKRAQGIEYEAEDLLGAEADSEEAESVAPMLSGVRLEADEGF